MTNEMTSNRHGVEEAWIGAFLLVIPGMMAIGVGAGLLVDKLVPCSIMGLGGGLLLWGLIAAFRKS